MEPKLKHEILEFYPDTVLAVREACGLAAPGRMDEALDLLQDWLSKQEHFVRKDFPRMFLETLLLTCKGSIEKTKKRIDLICTMRTFAPEFFAKFDAKNDFLHLHDVCKGLVMPVQTEDHYRVEVLWFSGKLYQTLFHEFFQYVIILSEYSKLHDYCNGFVCVVDLRLVNILELVSKVNLVELRNVVTLVIKGYGARVKSVHLVTPSKTIEVCVSMLKQVVSAKLVSRVKVHKTLEELHLHVPKHILPEDLGGEERSIDTLYDEWLRVYSSEEHIRHMREMRDARTDESRRRGEVDDPVFGVPGTFRALSVD